VFVQDKELPLSALNHASTAEGADEEAAAIIANDLKAEPNQDKRDLERLLASHNQKNDRRHHRRRFTDQQIDRALQCSNGVVILLVFFALLCFLVVVAVILSRAQSFTNSIDIDLTEALQSSLDHMLQASKNAELATQGALNLENEMIPRLQHVMNSTDALIADLDAFTMKPEVVVSVG
jgi:hypothetical protein